MASVNTQTNGVKSHDSESNVRDISNRSEEDHKQRVTPNINAHKKNSSGEVFLEATSSATERRSTIVNRKAEVWQDRGE